MNFRIEILPEKKLVVLTQKMSIFENKTFLLWNSFMKRKGEIQNAIGSDLFSIQIYESNYFEGFNPKKEFLKMAGLEVNSLENIPNGMEAYVLKSGKYAVFEYKGNPKSGGEAFQYIFQEWFPNSGFSLDNRPHFEILGTKYKNDSDESEEEIWIPIK
ncbi:GyrI-like domain-containing protein [Flavobacterium qiangtangense]|uniref:GyrI-like domain-containing protein n=1 Tax=Flavobacterium qiangtangense TaxID=1442595 RepID=A0ABW1PLZ8_9FLAO